VTSLLTVLRRRLSSWKEHFTWIATVSCFLIGLITFFLLAQGDKPKAVLASNQSSQLTPSHSQRLLMVFVDSLPNHVARNPSLMPHLSRLDHQGLSLDVEPCRDRLTYLCLRAMLTGVDESSLLSFHKNFDQQRSESKTLFTHLFASNQRIVAWGSPDFQPYDHHIHETHFEGNHHIDEANALPGLFLSLNDKNNKLISLSISSGDRAAHKYGTHAPTYQKAFQHIDQMIDQLVRHLPSDTNLLVFGDHGHDEQGRHLPGGDCTTYALYFGPSFNHQHRTKMHLSDHRAILGTLFGVPSPATYQGPPFQEVFSPDFRGQLPAHAESNLQGDPEPALAHKSRLSLLLSVIFLGTVAASPLLSKSL
jgi:hypothetical protein